LVGDVENVATKRIMGTIKRCIGNTKIRGSIAVEIIGKDTTYAAPKVLDI
jgi:hypothetical protein